MSSPSLTLEDKELIVSRLANRIGKNGVLRVISQKSCSQAENRELAIERLVEVLRYAVRQVPVRKKTRVSKGANTKLRSNEHQKKLKRSGSFAPRTPSPLRGSLWRCGGAQQVLGNRRRHRAIGRAQMRAANTCGVRGSHFPALFDYFNLNATWYKLRRLEERQQRSPSNR